MLAVVPLDVPLAIVPLDVASWPLVIAFALGLVAGGVYLPLALVAHGVAQRRPWDRRRSVGVMQDREAASKGNWEVESVNVLNMLLLC